jgi:hypothetical protein
MVFLFFVIFWDKEKPKTLIAHGLTQILLWMSVKALLWYIYHYNVGMLFQNGFSFNVDILAHIANYPPLFSVFGFLFIPIIVFYKYINNYFFSRAVFLFIPYFLVILIFGHINGLRIYGEMIPIVIVSVLLIVKNGMKNYYQCSDRS